jgi:hypothetical protein
MCTHAMRKVLEAAVCWALLLQAVFSWQMPQQLGRVEVSSTPSGAKVFINDRDTGQVTPAAFGMGPGEYKVVVKVGDTKLNCRLTNDKIKVSAGETMKVSCSAPNS